MATATDRRPPDSTRDALRRLSADVTRIAGGAGLAAVGVADAQVFADTRDVLYDRRRSGLHAGMQFTYRDPDRSTDPGRIVPGARALVVGAWSYRHAEPPADPTRHPVGTVARYARSDHYAPLRQSLGKIAARLSEDGWRAVVVVDDNALVDKAAAQRAGLGWFGRNTLLLLPGLGSWFVLGSVVTDAPLEPTGPTGPSAPAEGCGPCRRCRTACPTGALVADGVLDAGRCLAWLLQTPGTFPVEFREALGGRLYGCDDCQTVCPVNRTADRRDPPHEERSGSVATVELLALLEASDDELLAAHGRWYIPERDPRYLRRNALVAVGNTGDGSDPATIAAVSRWMDADDELLAEHARWAARRLGLASAVVASDRPDRPDR